MILPEDPKTRDAFLLIATFFIIISLPLLLFLNSSPILLQKQAAVSEGTVVANITPSTGSYGVGDTIDVELSIAPKEPGATVSNINGLALQVYYDNPNSNPSVAGTTPPFTLVGGEAGITLPIANVNGWTYTEKKYVANYPDSRFGIVVIAARPGQVDYSLTGNLVVARFQLKVEAQASTNPLVFHFDDDWSSVSGSQSTTRLDLLTTPTPQAQYTVAVCANSSPSALQLVSPLSTDQPAPPSVTLNWGGPSDWGANCAGNDNEYQVYLSTDQTKVIDFDNSSLVATNQPAQTSYQAASLLASTTYYWRVRATNGNLSTASLIGQFTTNETPCAYTPPTRPGIIGPTGGGTTPSVDVTLYWAAPSSWGVTCDIASVKQYYIWMSPDSNLVQSKDPSTSLGNPIDAGVADVTQKQLSALEPNTSYYWMVSAFNGTESTDSLLAMFKTPIASIVGVTVNGTVTVEQRTSFSGITITLTLSGGGTRTAVTDDAGAFSFTDVPAGTHYLEASLPNHLSLEGSFTVAGVNLTLPSGKLLAGDISGPSGIGTGDGTINIYDLSAIIPNWSKTNMQGDITDIDLNGKIDLYDLLAIAKNWGKTQPTLWNL